MSLSCFDTIYLKDEFDKFTRKYHRDSFCPCDDDHGCDERDSRSLSVMASVHICRDIPLENCLCSSIMVCSCRFVSSSRVYVGQGDCRDRSFGVLWSGIRRNQEVERLEEVIIQNIQKVQRVQKKFRRFRKIQPPQNCGVKKFR